MSNNKQQNYHNSTRLRGNELKVATEKALTQKEIIMGIFKQHPEPKTPFDVAVLLVKNGYKYPITSVRARMTVLAKEEQLIRSSTADVMGNYDARNHTWKLKGFAV